MELGTTDGHIFKLSPDIVGRHVYLIGASGTGKSTLLESGVLSLIQDGYGICFLDRHGDSVENITDRIPEKLTKRVIYWEPAENSIGFNPLALKDKSDRNKGRTVERILKALMHAWNPIARTHRNFYDEMDETLLHYLLRLLLDNDKKLTDIQRCLFDEKYRRQLIGNSPTTKDFWVDYATWNDKQRVEYTRSLMNKLKAFSNPIMAEMLSQDTLSLSDVMEEGKILMVNLAVGKTGETTSALIGALVTSVLTGLALEREKGNRRPFVLVIDEFASFVNPSIPDILSQTRKFGLSAILANQYETQLSPLMLDAVLANSATIISFRLGADVDRIGAQLDLNEPNRLRRLSDYTALVSTKRRDSRDPTGPAMPILAEIKTFPPSPPGGRLEAIKRRTQAVYGSGGSNERRGKQNPTKTL